jgi:hypothetical protein
MTGSPNILDCDFSISLITGSSYEGFKHPSRGGLEPGLLASNLEARVQFPPENYVCLLAGKRQTSVAIDSDVCMPFVGQSADECEQFFSAYFFMKNLVK